MNSDYKGSRLHSYVASSSNNEYINNNSNDSGTEIIEEAYDNLSFLGQPGSEFIRNLEEQKEEKKKTRRSLLVDNDNSDNTEEEE